MSTDDEYSADDELGLAAALAGLATLVAGRGTLEQLLAEVSTFAMVAIPGADGVGVTMLETGAPDTIVASAQFVREVDNVQYRLGEGPCISAADHGQTNGSDALGEDAAWPKFGPLAAALGIHSALSLPLVLSGEVLGALNVYAHARNAFTDAAKHIGEMFAAPAAVAIYNAGLLDKAYKHAAGLEVALTHRAVIDQAIGIVQARAGVTADEAFVRLRIISQREHQKLRIVARNLVDEAVRRARARLPPEDGEADS